jgi:CelD/BcsL family acetyltransferase involved in cellulose biosynthesis
MNMCIRRIERARDFMALAPLWSKLANESGQLSPFLSYDWFWCCWHGVWPRYRPEILVMEEAGCPVAIIPLMHWKERLGGLPVRCLGFLEYPSTPMADLLTLVAHDAVVETFLHHLASRSDWDIVWLQKLPDTSPTLKALERILPERLAWRRAGHCLLPYLTISGEWKSSDDSNEQAFKNTHERIHERLARTGNLSVEEHDSVDPWSPLFQETLDLIRRRSQKDWRASKAAIPRMPEFFSELTRRATKNGWLSFWVLKLNNRVIAMEYQLRAHGKALALWTDDDPVYQEFGSRHVLNLAILRSLFERGCIHEYGTGPGVKADRLWRASGSYETVHLKFYRPSFYSHLLYRIDRGLSQGLGDVKASRHLVPTAPKAMCNRLTKVQGRKNDEKT